MANRNLNEPSAIVDLEAVEGDDSDYEVNFDDPKYNDASKPTGKSPMDSVQEEVTQNVTSYMFEAGKERAKKVFNIYGNIDILRPYFDVEPQEVRQRLLFSLLPQKPSADVKQRVHRELYGPLMIVFTLIAMLLFQMKSSDHMVQEGTLMGTAFGVCFGYWFGVSSIVWVLSYVCNTHITMLQILSLIGYALFGHCIVIFLGTIFHSTHDHVMFYMLWLVFGGLSTLKMVSVLISRTSGQSQKLIVCGAVAAFHLLFLLYLHFAYHKIVEGLSEAIESRAGMPVISGPTSLPIKAQVEDAIVDINPAVNNAEQGNEVKRSIRSVPDNIEKPKEGVAEIPKENIENKFVGEKKQDRNIENKDKVVMEQKENDLKKVENDVKNDGSKILKVLTNKVKEEEQKNAVKI